MSNILLISHLIVTVLLILVVLFQKSEGGGLGMGSDNQGFGTGSTSKNPLSRLTWILTSLFFIIAILLTILSVKEGKNKSVCIEMVEKAIPRSGYQIFFNNICIGYVTSGTMSPSLSKGIAIGMIDKKFSKTGNMVTINIRGREKKGKIIKSPFYKLGTMLN